MTARPDHRVERLVFFSDAVIAIAITLLVIELHAPHLETGAPGAALDALAGLLPSFFAFVLSFVVIARLWIAHSAALAPVRRYDPALLFPNLALLLMIAFIPFATAFLGSNLGQMVPAAFYNATLLVTALFSARLCWIATDRTRNLGDHDDRERTRLRARAIAFIIAAALSVALAFIAPAWSQLGLATIPIWVRIALKSRKEMA